MMRILKIISFAFVLISIKGFSQESAEELKLMRLEDPALDSLLENRKYLPEENIADTLDGLQSEGWDGYLADTVPIADNDTSYFLAGDPEFNLIRAAEFGQFEVVKMLVDRGINVDAATEEGVTPLMYSSQNGDTAIMRYLVTHGADVNARPFNDVTPLIGAARTGNYDAVRLLLESEAKVDSKDEFDLTPLMHAAAYNYPGITELLIDSGADMEGGDWFGTRALMMAAYYNCLEAADVLLEKGADPDGKDNSGFTPLMISVQHGDYDMAWLLLDNGADPDIQNLGGLHALAIAVTNHDEDLIELLLESGADINRDINSSTNAFSLAKESGDETTMAFLVENGARHNRNPEISEIRGSLYLDFNSDDFMAGISAGVTENKTNIYMTTGFTVRPSAVRILRSENDTLFFQLWERRYLWPVSLGKDFIFATKGRNRYGVRLHVTGGLTWGNYRGSKLNPATKYLVMPGAGLFWRRNNVGISFDYQYVPFMLHDISNHRFRLSLQGFYDFRTRMKYARKDINWF